MAGRFMKIKRVVIPFITLVIITSQLAGCASVSSDETSKSMQESPDVSVEHAIPEDKQQSLDAAVVINTGDQQKAELSGDELIEYFQLVYDTCSALDTSYAEEQTAMELDILVSFCDTDNKKLPSDYEQQYRAWRPAETEQIPEATLTKPSTGSNQQGQQGGGQQSAGSQQQQGQTSDPNAPPGGYSSDPNHGFQELTPGNAGSLANEGDVEYSGWIS